MTLLDTIKTLPNIVEEIINNYYVIEHKLENYKNKYKKIIIVASGTSYNAGLTVKKMYENEFRISVQLFYSNDFLNYTNFSLFETDSLFILISQTGVTTQVYKSLEKIKEYGFNHIFITEYIDGPISKLSDCTIDMGSQKEPFIFRTIGFDATCITLIIIGSILSGWSKEKITNDLRNVTSNFVNIVSVAEEFYFANKDTLLSLKNYLFIGADNLYAIAKEADIKFMEILPIFSNSFELEESIHGPQNAFNKDTGYFILSRESQEYAKFNSIYEFIQNEVTNNVWVLIDTNEKKFISLNIKSSYFDFIEYITFFQVVAYYISTEKGRDLTKPVFPHLTKYINKHMEGK